MSKNTLYQNIKKGTEDKIKASFPIIFCGKGTLIQGDCLKVMKDFADNSFIMGFTSPPYLNAINYQQQIEKIQKKRGRWKREEVDYNEYRRFLSNRFKELLRIIKPGGYNIVNIAPVAWNGERIALPFHFVTWMERIGWKFKEDIIWEKPVARDRRSGVLMQHPYPGYYYPSLVTEYIFVFQKPAEGKDKENIYHFRSKQEKEKNKIDLSDYQGEKSKNVWKIRPVAPQENIHPCPFPTELAERILEMYSYKNDYVIDIFMGSGQMNIAAERLGRCHVGIDTEKTYIKYAHQKLKQEISKLKLD